jgi:hypothetical protein
MRVPPMVPVVVSAIRPVDANDDLPHPTPLDLSGRGSMTVVCGDTPMDVSRSLLSSVHLHPRSIWKKGALG